jgi:hypothetical protein
VHPNSLRRPRVKRCKNPREKIVSTVLYLYTLRQRTLRNATASCQSYVATEGSVGRRGYHELVGCRATLERRTRLANDSCRDGHAGSYLIATRST